MRYWIWVANRHSAQFSVVHKKRRVQSFFGTSMIGDGHSGRAGSIESTLIVRSISCFFEFLVFWPTRDRTEYFGQAFLLLNSIWGWTALIRTRWPAPRDSELFEHASKFVAIREVIASDYQVSSQWDLDLSSDFFTALSLSTSSFQCFGCIKYTIVLVFVELLCVENWRPRLQGSSSCTYVSH